MIIESLNIEYKGELLISDIDDCLMYTTMSLARHNINKREFFFNQSIYDEYKRKICLDAHLTPWGKDFLKLKQANVFKDYLLLTAASNRKEILCEKFSIETLKRVIENQSDQMKIDFLNRIRVPCIYVDDKVEVLSEIDNILVKGILHR